MSEETPNQERKCEICGTERPLDWAHIIPQRFLRDVEGISQGLIEKGGANTITLCRNHHTLFDRFSLDRKDLMVLWPRVSSMLAYLAYNLVGNIATRHGNGGVEFFDKRHQDMIKFISRFNFYVNT